MTRALEYEVTYFKPSGKYYTHETMLIQDVTIVADELAQGDHRR